MISVLIPVYNQLVTNLVNKLHGQLTKEKVNFEIICIDDASTISYAENTSLSKLECVYYEVLLSNIGRSKIRNLLASKANYDWLLFLDSDTLPVSSSFISNYLNIIENQNFKVFYGGILHTKSKTNQNQKLRVIYSQKRECLTVFEREKKPFHSAKTVNFLAHKNIFSEHTFCESLSAYGYEDLLFFLELKEKNIEVIHIDNPVFHEGIDTNSVFLSKTEAAVKNLQYLYENKYLKDTDTPLLKMYSLFRRNKLLWLAKTLSNIILKSIKYLLIYVSPSLLLLDIYKLGYFISVIERK